MGNRQKMLLSACRLLELDCGSMVLISPLYKTEAWGYESENWYINQVVAVDTFLSAEELLSATQKIELELGRTTKTVNSYSDRPIDIDILTLGDEVVKSEDLIIPHKEMANRRFVLQPLFDIAPNLKIPDLNKSVSELLATTSDSSTPEKICLDTDSY